MLKKSLLETCKNIEPRSLIGADPMAELAKACEFYSSKWYDGVQPTV